MAQLSFTQEQQAQLQVQRELERREWAEPEGELWARASWMAWRLIPDNVMAEYIAVLLANGSSKERVKTEMEDLVGADFEARFLDWLFDTAQVITSPKAASPVRERSPVSGRSSTYSRPDGRGRMLNHALGSLSQPQKRKIDDDEHERGDPVKKRFLREPPAGPRHGREGQSLAGRLGPGPGGPGPMQGDLQVRGMAANRGGFRPPQGVFGPGYRPRTRILPPPNFGAFFPPDQQQMMAQMMMMQAQMGHMGQMIDQMSREREATFANGNGRPPRALAPARIPHGTKLGNHSVSAVPPKRSSSPGPIPNKPTSKALCRYGVGCSNSRCPHSHPSPVATEKTGMVLSEAACESGRDCTDPECVKSHVSPAAVHGEKAGPSRMMCKFQNCTNPSCAFRHEDADGNPIPPPALASAKSRVAAEAARKEVTLTALPPPAPSSDAGLSDDGDLEVVMNSKSLMDHALEDKKTARPCRYGERCTRPICSFSHPPERPVPRGSRTPRGRAGHAVAKGGMNVSRKFGTTTLNPGASAFKPAVF